MFGKRTLILIVIALLGGCSDERDTASRPALPAGSLPGVYSGVFPCEGCPGIPTNLWLLPDGRFIFEQAYPATADRTAMTAHSLGRWIWEAESDELLLQGEGPGRKFTRPGRNALLLRTETGLEHRLTRDPNAPDFISTIRLSGLVRMQGGSALLSECLSGLEAPIARGGDFARFHHQYRSVAPRGQPTYVELDGRFSWGEDDAPRSLTIERFITVRPDRAC